MSQLEVTQPLTHTQNRGSDRKERKRMENLDISLVTTCHSRLDLMDDMFLEITLGSKSSEGSRNPVAASLLQIRFCRVDSGTCLGLINWSIGF